MSRSGITAEARHYYLDLLSRTGGSAKAGVAAKMATKLRMAARTNRLRYDATADRALLRQRLRWFDIGEAWLLWMGPGG